MHVKPAMYALFYEHLKKIAQDLGYNLVLHGSLDRDMDLIAIPWRDTVAEEKDLIEDFEIYLTGRSTRNPDETRDFSTLPGGRHVYIIEFNRGDKRGEWNRFEDEQYYLDISITPKVDRIKKDGI